MAQDKNSFILYADQQGLFSKLPDDIAGKLIKHIFLYITDQNPETDDLLLNIAFEPIKMQLKRDLKDWETKKQIRKETGRLGGIKSGESRLSKQMKQPFKNRSKQSNPSFFEANEAVTVNGNVTVNDNVINRANALVVEKPTTGVTKEYYQKLSLENNEKPLKDVVISIKEVLLKKPLFIEPYMDYWNLAVDGSSIPKVKSSNDSRVKKLKTRLSEPDFDFIEIIKTIKGNAKLKNESPWFSFDWVIENQGNYVKLLEGNYNG